jgi:hypothetical protein
LGDTSTLQELFSKTMKSSLTVIPRYLFFVTASALVVFGIGSFMRDDPNLSIKLMYNLYAVLMLGDAIAMLVCGLYINRHIKTIFWFAVVVLGLNIVLTLFDQFGLIDLLFSLLNIITLTILLALRKELLPQ